MFRRSVICEFPTICITHSSPKSQQSQQYANMPAQNYPTQPYYRSHVHVDTRSSVTQGQYQPAASTSMLHSQTNQLSFVPSGFEHPPSHHAHTQRPSQSQPLTPTPEEEQAQFQKASLAGQHQQRDVNDHKSTQEAFGTGIIRAKNTYTAHATAPKVSTPVESSVDHETILRELSAEVYGLLKVLSRLCHPSRTDF